MEQTDGERLSALLGDKNRAAFARQHKLRGGGSLISQHVSGHRPISLEAAKLYAAAFGVPLEAVSPSKAKMVRDASSSLTTLTSPTPQLPTPTLAQALPVVLDAMAHAAERDRVRTALLALLDDDAPAYRQRLAELLTQPKTEVGAPISEQHLQALQDLSDHAEAQHAATRQRRRTSGA